LGRLHSDSLWYFDAMLAAFNSERVKMKETEAAFRRTQEALETRIRELECEVRQTLWGTPAISLGGK
jgi:hypothetical protein